MLESSGRQTENDGAQHDRKSNADDPAVLPKPRGVAEDSPKKSDSPESFGLGASSKESKIPDAFGRGKPFPKQKEAPPEREHRRAESEGDENDPDQQKPQDKEEDKEGQPRKPPFYKRPVLMTILIVSVLLVVIVAVVLWLYFRQFESTDDAFIDGHVVQVSPKVAELVKAVHIDDNWHVKPGDVLIELDKRDYQNALEQAKAGEAAAQSKLAQAKTQLDVAHAKVGEAEAQVAVAQTNAENADRDFQRFEALDPRARSQQQLDNATAAQRGTAALVKQAQANLTGAKAQVTDAEQAIKTAEADVTKAHADTHRAELQLGYCTIVAPVEGLITKKSVEPGQYVQVDQPMFSIVPTDVWVTANYKETQLNHMRIGQRVDIKVDAYSGLVLHGKIDSIQNGTGQRFTLLPPENATGNYVKVVQRVPVKIVLDPGQTQDSNHLLAPGLSVTPKVRVR